jgi:hypothetical protein
MTNLLINISVTLLLFMVPLEVRATGMAQMEAELILGVTAYARDGAELGEVSQIKPGDDGTIAEIYIHVPSRLGIGERTVAIPVELVISLQGAVVVALSADEVARLPTVSEPR